VILVSRIFGIGEIRRLDRRKEVRKGTKSWERRGKRMMVSREERNKINKFGKLL